MKIMVIQTTHSSKEKAEKMARRLIESKLAACVQLSEVTSIYSWKNEIENQNEILMTIKTLSELFERVKKKILETHEYEVPEIIGMECDEVAEGYLKWIRRICVSSEIDLK